MAWWESDKVVSPAGGGTPQWWERDAAAPMPAGKRERVLAVGQAMQERPLTRIAGAFAAAEEQEPTRLGTRGALPDYGASDYLKGSLPFGDELAAAVQAPARMMRQGGSFGEAYDIEKALENRYREEYAADHPVAAPLTTAASTVAVGPGRMAASLLGRVGQGAAGGGALGAAYGAGEGEGVGRVTEGARGAAIGVGLGATLPPVLSGATGLVRRVLSPATSTLGNRITPAQRAASITEEALTRDQVPVTEAARRLRAAQAVNPDAVLADVAGENTRALARTAVNTPGAARERITAFVAARNLAQPQRIVEATRNILRNPNDFGSTVARQAAQREQVASPIYDQAFANSRPVNVSGVVRHIDNAIRPGVNQVASPLADLRPDGITATLGKLRGFFQTAGNQRVDLRQLHQVKMELDDLISSAMRSGDTTKARAVMGVKNELLRAMDSASPLYKKARDIYSSSYEMEEALEVGRNIFRMSGDDVRKTLAGMSSAQREMVQLGSARAIYDQIQRVRDGRDVVKAVFGTPAIRDTLKAAFQNEEAFNRFRAVLSREAGMRRTADAVTGNSTTARQISDLLDARSGGVGQDVLSQLLEGRPVRALATAVRQAVLGEKGINEKVAERIGDMLLSNDPAMIQNALAALGRRQGAVKRLANRMAAAQQFIRNEGTVTGVKALPAQ